MIGILFLTLQDQAEHESQKSKSKTQLGALIKKTEMEIKLISVYLVRVKMNPSESLTYLLNHVLPSFLQHLLQIAVGYLMINLRLTI
jgi:hypothetical protein